jgi:DNA-directed RNA polymerase specialized sigma subunit
MSPTVHELRNAIRAATDRFEREVEASFTKEELQAICAALGIDIDETERPSTTRMRRLIRAAVGVAASAEAADGATFRKADLEAIADSVGSPSRNQS